MTSWDRLAPLYDLQLPLERSALRAAVRLANPGAGDRVLDLATGSGGFLRQLATLESPPREVVGVDVSARMLGRVPPLPNGWRLNRVPAERVPLSDESFDIVAATYLLHILEAPQRQAVLREARRLLRPEGRLVVATAAAPRSAVLSNLTAPVLALARRSTGVLAGLRPLNPTPDLERAGFAVRAEQRTGCGYPSYVVLASPAEDRREPSSPAPGRRLR